MKNFTIENLFSTTLSPLLKWPGGKEKELKHILPKCPSNIKNYYEPFVGGGAVYTSIKAQHYFINDISEELINLYQHIAENSELFFYWATTIITMWQNTLSLGENSSRLVDAYKKLRSSSIQISELRRIIQLYCTENQSIIRHTIPAQFTWNNETYFQELPKVIEKKLLRMRCIEIKKQEMPDVDIPNNITTAFMSHLYTYLRSLYNDHQLRKKNPELSSALFLFIRNYAYSSMFRYNEKKEFNVPYGGLGYNKKSLQNKITYYQSSALQNHFNKTTIKNLDFENFLISHAPAEQDFIFLDPPYDSDFSTYALNSFTKKDQERLRDYLCNQCKAKWMMVIKNTPFIYSLYCNQGLNIMSFEKKYLVSFMNRNDKDVQHLMITNYDC